MASIEKEEITGVDGRVIKRRVLRADSIRITRPDGTKEELKDLPENFRAAEDPWTLADRPTLWELFNFPFGSFNLSQGLPHIITFLNEHGETLLRLGAIAARLLESEDAEHILVGEEIPQS